MLKLVRLHSGFSTIYKDGFLKELDEKERLPGQKGDIYYSPMVDKLFDRLVTGKDESTKIEFDICTDALELAIGCFGTNSLKTWTTLQTSMSPSHVRFLKSTLGFIIGVNRELSFMTEYRMLKDNIDNNVLIGNYDQYFIGDRMLTSNGHLELLGNQPFTKLLGRWVGRDTGLGDLVHTLKIIFGNINT